MCRHQRHNWCESFCFVNDALLCSMLSHVVNFTFYLFFFMQCRLTVSVLLAQFLSPALSYGNVKNGADAVAPSKFTYSIRQTSKERTNRENSTQINRLAHKRNLHEKYFSFYDVLPPISFLFFSFHLQQNVEVSNHFINFLSHSRCLLSISALLI